MFTLTPYVAQLIREAAYDAIDNFPFDSVIAMFAANDWKVCFHDENCTVAVPTREVLEGIMYNHMASALQSMRERNEPFAQVSSGRILFSVTVSKNQVTEQEIIGVNIYFAPEYKGSYKYIPEGS